MHDDARAAVADAVVPYPAQSDTETISRADQKVVVRQLPDPPRKGTTQLHPPHVNHRQAAADGGQVPLMPVFERPVSGLALQTPSNQVSDVLPLLFGGRGDARHGLPIGHGARGCIADGEDLRATGHRQVRANDHSTSTIRRSAQQASRGRRLDSGGPDDGLGRKGLAALRSEEHPSELTYKTRNS